MSVLKKIRNKQKEEELNVVEAVLDLLDNDEIDGADDLDKVFYKKHITTNFLEEFCSVETDPEVEQEILSKLNAYQVKDLYFAGFFKKIEKDDFVNSLTNDSDLYEVALDLYYTDPKLFNNDDSIQYLLSNINDYLDNCNIEEVDIQEQVLQLYTSIKQNLQEIDVDNILFDLPALYISMFITTEENYDRTKGLSAIIDNQETDNLKEIMLYLSSSEKEHCKKCLMEWENEYLADFYINDLDALYDNKELIERYIHGVNDKFVIGKNYCEYPIEIIFNKISEVMEQNNIKANDLEEEAREILVANSTREKALNF